MHDPRLVKPLVAILDGKLRLDRLLGAGGMGAVYLATHLALGHRVAVKVLGAEERRSPEALARFVQEAQAASRVANEHVVRVFDLGHSDEGEPYIVMELLEGEDLAQILERELRLPRARALHLVLQACVGVAAAHAAGLVHRDLKPANLFATWRPGGGALVKVLDFGLSKIQAPDAPGLTRSSATFGTPLYMAPEQIMSVKRVDARCDQHALAMILFELLTGEPPYTGETSGAITVQIVTAPPPSARERGGDVPPGLDAAIRRALAKRPEDRFADLAAFAAAIAPFADRDDARLVGAVRDALARAPAPAAAAIASDDPSTIPLAVRPDSHAALSSSTSGARGVLGVRGLVGAAALALSVAGAAAWLTVRAAGGDPPGAGPASTPGAAAASATAEGTERTVPTAAPAPDPRPDAPSPAVDGAGDDRARAAGAETGVTSAPAPKPDRSAEIAPAAGSAASRRPPPTRPRPPPPRPPKAASKDPTEVFGARR
jgi:serine/threonine-protein kinase